MKSLLLFLSLFLISCNYLPTGNSIFKFQKKTQESKSVLNLEDQALLESKSSDLPPELADLAVSDQEEIIPVIDILSRDDQGNTVLHLASFNGDLEQIHLILAQEGVDVDVVNIQGETPLHLAVSQLQLEVVEKLVKEGTDIDKKNIYGEAPVHLVLTSQGSDVLKAEVLDFLLEYGADPDLSIEDEAHFGDTPLHLAVSSKDLELVKTLVNHDANLNIPNRKGNTPLHEAIEGDSLDIALFLFKSGADNSAQNLWGQTPTFLAKKHFNKEIVDIFGI